MSGAAPAPVGIVDYASLQKAVATWLMRDPADPDIAAAIPIWIQLAEAEFSYDAKLGMTEVLARKPLTAEYDVLPHDFIDIMEVSYVGSALQPARWPIKYVTREHIAVHSGVRSHAPKEYTIIGNMMQFGPAPHYDHTTPHYFELLYHAKAPPLGSVGDGGAAVVTNDILANHPSIYLYGALVQSAPFIGADARLAVWKSFYADALGKASQRSTSGRIGRITQRTDENVGHHGHHNYSYHNDYRDY